MNKISLFFLVIAYITCQYLRDSINTSATEPYHHFDWLDEDEYTISIKYATSGPSDCCLWNGTKYCKGTCNGTDTVSCKFTGASCGADSDNPATKYYYALYCNTAACASETAAAGLTDEMSVDVTVAVSTESYIRYSMVLLLSLLVL
jgi:hypothetical protein